MFASYVTVALSRIKLYCLLTDLSGKVGGSKSLRDGWMAE